MQRKIAVGVASVGAACLVSWAVQGGPSSGRSGRGVSKRIPSAERIWSEGLDRGVNWGVAARYPDDVNIKKDPFVIATEGFEGGGTLHGRMGKWIQKTTDGPPYTGSHCGVATWAQGDSGSVYRIPLPKPKGQERRAPAVFIRAYHNFDSTLNPKGSEKGRIGLKGIGLYSEKRGTPRGGERPTGKDWYGFALQYYVRGGNGGTCTAQAYCLNPYPELAHSTVGQFSVHPNGFYSQGGGGGKDRVSYDEWRCYELGLYLNTPGLANGEVRFWLDGVLRFRATQVRFRDIEDLYPSHARITPWRTKSSVSAVTTMHRYIDNIVISRRYIGPVRHAPRTRRPRSPRTDR